MDYRKRFVVRPGSKVRLARVDPSFTATYTTRESAQPEIDEHRERMQRLQYRLHADASQSLLIVLQGMDAAGKDGLIRHLFRGMNPQGTRLCAFKQPTPVELAHDFLQRVHAHTPGNGEVAIFNRSHYEDVLIVRVHKLVPRAVWSRRYALINDFETLLAEHRTRIVKFFLHISPEEQLARLQQRLDDRERQWKIGESDYADRELWPKYMKAYEDALGETSTEQAPWYVIPADRKWFRDLAVSAIVADTLQDMGLRFPPPHVDIDALRARYHAS